MFDIRYVCENDRAFWVKADRHIAEKAWAWKVLSKRVYVICDDEKPMGVMRYNLFWDAIPFLTFLWLEEPYRKRGFGRQAVRHWEAEMRAPGHEMTMASTQADEEARHFYRKPEYMERGGLFGGNTPFAQPMEIILMKTLQT